MKWLYALGSLGLMYSCSQAPETSRVADVDLNLNGKDLLLWVDGAKISVAQCAINTVPQRSTCQTNPGTSALSDATSLANSSIDAASATAMDAQQKEITRLKGVDPTMAAMSAQLSGLNSQITGLGTKIGTEKNVLTQDQTQKAAQDQNIAFYQGQIKSVNDQLTKTPDDRDLLRLREQYQSELDKAQAASNALAASIAELTDEIAQDQASLTKAQADLTAQTAAYKSAYDALKVHSDLLNQLAQKIADLASAKKAVAIVVGDISNTGIVFRGSLLASEEQAALGYLANAVQPPVLLQQGTYVDQRAYYCKQGVTFSDLAADGSTKLTLQFLSPCAATAVLACDSTKRCSGDFYGRTLSVVIADSKHYSFYDPDVGSTGQFAFSAGVIDSVSLPFTNGTRAN